MTLDDETAGRIADEVWSKRGKRHTVSGEEYVRAGYAARDAEVEELRARLAKVREWAESVALQPDPPADDEMAGQINAAGDALAILDWIAYRAGDARGRVGVPVHPRHGGR